MRIVDLVVLERMLRRFHREPDRPFVLHPGLMISQIDTDTHLVSELRLAELYQVPLAQCHVLRHHDADYGAKLLLWADLIHLTPRFRGDYSLADAQERQRAASRPVWPDRGRVGVDIDTDGVVQVYPLPIRAETASPAGAH